MRVELITQSRQKIANLAPNTFQNIQGFSKYFLDEVPRLPIQLKLLTKPQLDQLQKEVAHAKIGSEKEFVSLKSEANHLNRMSNKWLALDVLSTMAFIISATAHALSLPAFSKQLAELPQWIRSATGAISGFTGYIALGTMVATVVTTISMANYSSKAFIRSALIKSTNLFYAQLNSHVEKLKESVF